MAGIVGTGDAVAVDVAVGVSAVGVACGAVVVGTGAIVGNSRVPVAGDGPADEPVSAAAGVGSVDIGTASVGVTLDGGELSVCDLMAVEAGEDGVVVFAARGAACWPPQATSVNVNNNIAIRAFIRTPLEIHGSERNELNPLQIVCQSVAVAKVWQEKGIAEGRWSSGFRTPWDSLFLHGQPRNNLGGGGPGGRLSNAYYRKILCPQWRRHHS